jgi:hypothetical protein
LGLTYKNFCKTIKVGTIIATNIVKKMKDKKTTKGMKLKRTEMYISPDISSKSETIRR